jgi:hypothetical protein
MVLLCDISSKIPMHLMNLFSHALKETTHLFLHYGKYFHKHF